MVLGLLSRFSRIAWLNETKKLTGSCFFNKSLSDPVLFLFSPSFFLKIEGERERGGVGRFRDVPSVASCWTGSGNMGSCSEWDWSSL
jgi:hypothetical protein